MISQAPDSKHCAASLYRMEFLRRCLLTNDTFGAPMTCPGCKGIAKRGVVRFHQAQPVAMQVVGVICFDHFRCGYEMLAELPV